MIHVTVVKTVGQEIKSFTVTGHADFSEYGSDIVCAGVSAVTFGAINSVEALTQVVPDVEQGGDGGYLQCVVPENLPQDTKEKVQLLLEGMLVSLQTIEESYGEYIKITFKK